MKYCEFRNKESVDWNEVLKNPPPRSSSEHKKLIFLADSWVTCVCGCQEDSIPRNRNGSPEDIEMVTYGIEFADAIADYNIDYAKEMLVKIEERSLVLLSTILQNN